MTVTIILFVVAAVLFSSFIRGIAGFGFAIVAVPVVSLVLPPLEAVALAVLMQLIVGVHDVHALRKDIHKPSLLRLALGSMVGTPIGILALALLTPDAARVLISVSVMFGLVLLLRYKPTEPRPNGHLAAVTGVASGVFSGLAAMPGPPAVAYYLGVGMPAKETRASLLIFFFFSAMIATPGLAVAGAIDLHMLLLVALSVPGLIFGTWLGTEAFKRLGSDQYRTIAIGMMAVSAVISGWRGLAAFL